MAFVGFRLRLVAETKPFFRRTHIIYFHLLVVIFVMQNRNRTFSGFDIIERTLGLVSVMDAGPLLAFA